MITYYLTQKELKWGADVGAERHIQAIIHDWKAKHGFFGDIWGSHIEGAMGELVFCERYLEREWEPTVNTFKRPDVGPYQVRCQKEMIIRTNFDGTSRPDGDAADEPYVWVKPGGGRIYHLMGWIWGYNAPKCGHWKGWGERPKAWFIDHVEPIETLPSEAEARAAKRPSFKGHGAIPLTFP